MDSNVRLKLVGKETAAAQANGLIQSVSGGYHEPTKSSNISYIPARDMPEPKRRSNHDIVAELMNSSEFGAMSEAFVVAAIRSYASTIAGGPVPTEDGNGVISNIAWYNLAKSTVQRIDLMYKQNEEIEVNQVA